ncbi:MAG: hypothetical protein QXF76_02085 [Candidatus Anstonellales archaeon]
MKECSKMLLPNYDKRYVKRIRKNLLTKMPMVEKFFVNVNSKDVVSALNKNDRYTLSLALLDLAMHAHKDYSNAEKIAKSLILFGADLRISDDLSNTPLHYICYYAHKNYPKAYRLIKLFIEYGADPSYSTGFNLSPFQLFCLHMLNNNGNSNYALKYKFLTLELMIRSSLSFSYSVNNLLDSLRNAYNFHSCSLTVKDSSYIFELSKELITKSLKFNLPFLSVSFILVPIKLQIIDSQNVDYYFSNVNVHILRLKDLIAGNKLRNAMLNFLTMLSESSKNKVFKASIDFIMTELLD